MRALALWPVTLATLAFLAGALVAAKLLPRQHPSPGAAGPVMFNQHLLENMTSEAVNVADPYATFAYVFARLPLEVTVYPTENYYYFRLYTAGHEINGNIRLDVNDREAGILNFGYFSAHPHPEQPTDLDLISEFIQLGADDGVTIRAVRPLVYHVTYADKTITFNLNDLNQALPGSVALAENETFIARTFDESGFQFLLIYDEATPQFRFLLDPTAPLPDVLQERAPRLAVGRLSGFAFYTDTHGRQALIGVNTNNIRRNNYYDGPFDQLADNFTTGDSLRQAMEAAYPYTRGRIDERGVFLTPDGQRSGTRLAITPYLTYQTIVELQQKVVQCAAAPETLRCLTYDSKQASVGP